MVKVMFPTSQDIYIEVNGKKLAVVESYKARSTRESRYMEAFGENQPVGTIPGRIRHVVQLSRVYACEDAVSDGVCFYDLTDFNVVVVKPDRRIVYSQCEWYDISEAAELNDTVLENVSLLAGKRMEIPVLA